MLPFSPSFDDSGILHFKIQVVAFTRALTDPGKDGNAAMGLGDVIDQLLDDDRLTNARTAKQADFTAFKVRQRRSTTLIPVTRISEAVACSSKLGALRWIVYCLSVLMGPRSSIGSPTTFMMRPSVAGPTGT